MWHGVGELTMSLQISGNNLEITPSLRRYIEEKIGGISKYLGDIKKMQVNCIVDHHHQKGEAVHRVEITVHVPKEVFHIQAAGSEMHAAIDKASDKLQQHVEKYKKHFMERDRTALRRLKETVLIWPKAFMRKSVSDTDKTPQRREGEVASGGIDAHRALTDSKPMTEAEAMAEWRVSGLSAYLYLDAESHKPTMLATDERSGKRIAVTLD
ncbi:MAG: ribosomal subunit interface protein [Parcubacteria group bacterium CG08_land_8_20_14_0_20_48_21]|nr:MAG: ribosomal subunit interface protein [Parcubacteria group bacterium CG2_30_48_51]PIS32984.1 MAG: ribosomal subunit interface protein [Parcubacteria group bacterium CG08_land_8_20_14_0_20_48_21]PIW78903.1 MAG: ribosomal subunit interface protein [Parcubacteria group bacterium CG_4_8_14_3_um_filter_48_16]PIY77725.1 MAG: ribosomal subunit interface protein [Parcubacteria group bacterium CG_4_10_14_0_8_um_filter_48_154]PIZ77747.1 MAG: ribosomal subunit interface protein [bacterium CG_4_10_14